MNVPQDTLNRWRRQAGSAWGTLSALGFDMAANRRELAEQRRASAEDTLRLLVLDMEKAGADPPLDTVVSRNDVPLHLLDTPANRAYLAALRVAWEAALAVDRERYGESIGTDGCAQVIEMVLADVETEVLGAAGSGRE